MANNKKDERRTTHSRAARQPREGISRAERSQSRSGARRPARQAGQARPARKPQGVIPVARAALGNAGHKMIRSPLVPIIGGLVLLCCLFAVAIWALTNKNAVEVYVNDQVVATVAAGKTITAEWFFEHAVAKLETELGTKVQIDDKVTIKPVHRSKKKLSHVDYAISEVYKKFQTSDYKVEASEIIVNSVPICIVSNADEARALEERILTSYSNPDTVHVSKSFVDDVKISQRSVSSDEIISADKAYTKLTVHQESEIVYTVKKNDSRWKICNDYGISEARLLELNPELSMDGGLMIGQKLNLIVPQPLISVKTVVEITYTDVEPKTIEKRENASKPKSWSNVIQQGKDGQRLVTAHVTYVNGVETGERVEIPEKTTITIPPLVEIVEVGTQ